MRVENDSKPQPNPTSKPGAFAAQLKKVVGPLLKPKAKPAQKGVAPGPLHGKPGIAAAGKPAASVAHAKASPLANPQAGLRKTEQGLVITQKAEVAFKTTLHLRREEAEVQRPERRQVAEQLARLLSPVDARTMRRLEGEREPGPDHERRSSIDALRPAGTRSPPEPTVQGPAPAQPSQPAVRAGSLVTQIESLLERVELLAKAAGPAIEVGLTEGNASRIEVIRTGKGEVSLRLEARSPGERRALAGQAAAIHAALSARGLRVKDLRVA